jgi:ribosomal protein S18 acetylase RimI-like enzyme
MTDYRLVETPPTADEYAALRAAVGWQPLPREAIEIGIANSLYAVTIRLDGAAVGCGRVIGDSGIYYYLQDVAVHPDHQGNGLGARITDALMAYLRAHAAEGAFVGLMAAWHAAPFYERYGFTIRQPERPGMEQRARGQG